MSKTDLVKTHLKNGNIKDALKIASTFRLSFSKEELSVIRRGYECITHSAFYQQILNIEEAIEKATTLITNRYV
jgi:hypothetical protein